MDNFTISLDWFAATVGMDAEALGHQLAAWYGGAVVLARPKNGYTFGYGVAVGDDVLCEFHVREGESPWVFATGPRSQDLQDFCQSLPLSVDVLCTRVDAACDVYDAEWFPVLVEVGKRWAVAHNMRTEQRGDWLNPVRGRTWYLGSRESKHLYRVYEKGRKERTDPNWIRCEVQYMPKSAEERRAAVRASASQLWVMHAGPIFGKSLALDLGEVFFRPVQAPARVRRDVDRARASLCRQYGKVIAAWLQESGGDPVAFVGELLCAVEHERKVASWKSAPVVLSPELSP